ncbi:hypothetical protein CC1G_15500 [Coprinopsis cinerea okayama7|uniref:Uncharacterized protein n=1 Tax=Coprinopsis cinerea (strain Okayama-7 / 130 / ATCC MYA-4618 / FGSC 9003) TaxID=240176 RepID=D6RN44_COPC7|nr:hypothetical protein CC1G_15500 [Coprinopsis cinerea okayama7\|eukprot:XP_002910959.1 hypothetical protein CC1G_15500 [Coprinopsis cinerea okayama7\
MERGVMLDPSDGYKMTEGQDEDVAVQGAVEKAASNEGSLNGSYVRLSACWSTETARESNKSGHFTSALLKRLRLDDGPKLTYAQLIRGLGPLEGQRPQCEGANSSYIVFQGRPQTLLPLSYLVTSSGPFVRVSAGEADGVTKGDRFDIFADGMPIETAIVSDSPTAFTSDLDIDADKFNELTASAQSVCAVQSRIASKPKFRVYLATSDPNSGICSQLEQQVARLAAADDMRSIVSVLHGEPADMIIRIDVGEDGRHHATFELHHALLPQPIHLHSPAPATHQAVYRVMTAAADFYWHLDRTSGNKGKIANSIQVDLHRLKPMAPGTNMKTVKGTKLIPGEAIDYDGSEEFGLTVSCRSGLSLHVAAFFFNLSTLSIEPLFLPPIALNQDVEPTLNKKEKSLPIGYQSSGWPPLTFSFPESVSVGDTVNVGFIKVFLCHDYVEYERIIQGSPFKDLSAFDHLSNVTDALDFGKGLDTSPDGEPLSGGRPRGSLLSKLFNVFSSSTFSYFRNGSSAYDWDTVTRLVTLRRT